MKTGSFALVIFGATGNLAQLKLIPALYDLTEAGVLSERMTIIGVGRKPMTNDEFRSYTDDVLHKPNHHHQHPIKQDVLAALVSRMKYIAGDMSMVEVYEKLNTILKHSPSCTNKMYYLATYPELYKQVFDRLSESGLNDTKCGWVRVMVEKPIGFDESTAQEVNSLLSKYYTEEQIFRLDHYLGKETLQNILTFRFGNGIFESLIHRDHIDHIQITASEEFGIGDRGGYYDSVGALRDVGQNHILQMIALSTMDMPVSFTNESVTKSRIELITWLVPDQQRIVFGQYEGYQKELHVPSSSTTDTFFAFKTTIDTDRFHNVPIYVRAGKKMNRTVTEIAIVFNVAGKRLFRHIPGGCEPNVLIYRIQPNEGIVLKFLSKVPGADMKLSEEYMQYCYRQKGLLPDPYLRLLIDALRGDQTFFIDGPEAEVQWKFIDPLFAQRTNPEIYTPGTWGPASADTLIQADGRKWIEPSVAFCSL